MEFGIGIDRNLLLSGGAVAIALVSFIISLFRFRRQRKDRGLIDFVEKQIEDLEHLLTRNKEAFDANAQRMAEQARRINWLETRVRQPKLVSEDVVDDTAAGETPKLNITERRHRVIKLTSRGQNVETIATALGMLPGEVELIVNLNKAAAASK